MGPVLAVVVVGFVALAAWLMVKPAAASTPPDNGGGGGGGGGNGGGGGGGGGAIIDIPDKLEVVVKIPEKVKEIIDPPEPSGPDPSQPTIVPTPGKYYQCKQGVWGVTIAKTAYGDGTGAAAPLNRWNNLIVPDPLNAWIHGTDSSVPWQGGIFPKYNGWNTAWQSGYKYPIIYIPVLS